MPACEGCLLVLGVLSALHTVLGHGFIKQVTVDGTVYPGFDPNLDPYADPVPDRVIRRIPNDGPVTDILIADLTCNRYGENGSTALATVSDGGTVKFQWNQWLSDHLGPVWTYMTSCNGQCQDLNLDLDQGGKDLKWFKIDAQGYDSSKKTWASQDLIAAGDAWTSTIPKGLKPGQYLLRHEVVALHSNPAQFYPSCLQVTVSGSGTNYPSDSDTVAIPGLFNDFVWPDIWSDSFNSFTIPGPPVISFDGSTDTASAWSTPAAQPTASVGVIGINGGDSGARPTSDDDGDDYGTTTTTARKAGATSPAPVAAGTATARPKCVAMANPALARRSSGLKKRLAAALTKHRIRLSLNGLFSTN